MDATVLTLLTGLVVVNGVYFRLKIRDFKAKVDSLEIAKDFLYNLTKKYRKQISDLDNKRKALIEQAEKYNRRGMVQEWMTAMGVTQGSESLDTLWNKIMPERIEKLDEEVLELYEAVYKMDTVGVIDAIADVQYVLETIALHIGYDSNEAFVAVHKSNMTKDIELFSKDKRGKGTDFKAPDFTKVGISMEETADER